VHVVQILVENFCSELIFGDFEPVEIVESVVGDAFELGLCRFVETFTLL